jgi:hypothetical protein
VPEGAGEVDPGASVVVRAGSVVTGEVLDDTGSGGAPGGGGDADSPPGDGRERRRAATARIQRRWSSTRSAGLAPHIAANRSTGAKPSGTASPAQYRCSVEAFMFSRRASAA